MNDMKKATIQRLLSAAVALPVYAFIIYTDMFQSIPILVASIVISLVMLYEFYQICESGSGQKVYVKSGLAAGFFINVLMYMFAYGNVYGYSRFIGSYDARALFAVLTVLISIVFIIQIFSRPIKGAIYAISVTISGLVLLVIPFSHIVLMKSFADGFIYIVILHAVIMLNDSGAYFGGVLFGRHKTNFPVSPNKSWEGYFFGMLFSIISMMIITQVLDVFFAKHLFTMVESAILGIGLSIFGHIGDLAESAIKRDGAIKDSGSIIPGHGGMWDVFDSLVYTFPIFYYYLLLKGVA